jgi:GNAT superfamily N-acetyltransferase
MITLREARLSDYASIAKLHAESWQQNYRGIYSDQFLDNEVEQDRLTVWHKRLSAPASNQQVIIATQDETVVGFACLLLDDDPTFGSLLDNLHVTTNVQKTGIGKLLMKECARRIANKNSSNRMYLWVYEANENARRVYERLGAEHFETVEKPTEDRIRPRSAGMSGKTLLCFFS